MRLLIQTLFIFALCAVIAAVMPDQAASFVQALTGHSPELWIAVFGTATVVTNVGKGIAAKRQVGSSPSQAEPKYIGMGTGATGAARTAVAADTALSTEVETRANGTSSNVTTTQTNDTYQTVGTITATATRAVDEAGTFDAASTGNMDVSATFAVINLSTGDSIQFTFKKQFT